MDRNTYETLEYLFAEQAHESWSGWMRYLFRFGKYNEDGSFTIDADKTTRWRRQAATEFEDLSPEEQKSDVIEAQKYLQILKEMMRDERGERNRMKRERDEWKSVCRQLARGLIRRPPGYHDADGKRYQRLAFKVMKVLKR